MSEELRIRVENVEAELEKQKVRQLALEKALGQLGVGYAALAGATRFAAEQARALGELLPDERIREAFRDVEEDLDDKAEDHVGTTLDPAHGARPDDRG